VRSETSAQGEIHARRGGMYDHLYSVNDVQLVSFRDIHVVRAIGDVLQRSTVNVLLPLEVH
jgi:hypothetical protein